MALVNVTVFCILVVAMMGLFVLVGSIMLLIELAVFPPNLMTNWPSLEEPTVGFTDLIRVGGFISTLGVLSGHSQAGSRTEWRSAISHSFVTTRRRRRRSVESPAIESTVISTHDTHTLT